jgi:cyanophycin synthetase
VVDYKMVNVTKLIPAAVSGDGMSTISQLIERENLNPLRGVGFERPLSRILVDDEVHRMLSRQDLSLESIPESDEWVQLRANANGSTGGAMEDKTAVIHPDNRRVAEAAAKLLGTNVAGVDFLSPDISRFYRDVGGAICELNVGPAIHIHDIGKERSVVSAPIVDSYFGVGDGRIPTAIVAGGQKGSTIADLLAQVLGMAEYGVGVATRDGLWVCAEQYESANCTDINSAKRVLIDPTVEAAIVEADSGVVLQHGLGIDRAAVSLVTSVNVGAASGLPAETISPEEVIARSASFLAVLNADDEQCLALREGLTSEHVCFVSRGERVSEEVASVAWCRDLFCLHAEDGVVSCQGEELILEVSVDDVAAGGHYGLPRSIAYAIPLAWGMGLAPDTIKAAILEHAK